MSLGSRVDEEDYVWEQFARRHLATREERAVYHTLVERRANAWSAVEIAERNRLDPGEIEHVLEAFAAAGIAATVETPQGPRLMWRSEMNYLFGDASDPSGWVDPVCGMPVGDDGPYVAEDVHRRTQRFCSSLCLAAFLAFRGTFSAPAPPVVRARG